MQQQAFLKHRNIDLVRHICIRDIKIVHKLALHSSHPATSAPQHFQFITGYICNCTQLHLPTRMAYMRSGITLLMTTRTAVTRHEYKPCFIQTSTNRYARMRRLESRGTKPVNSPSKADGELPEIVDDHNEADAVEKNVDADCSNDNTTALEVYQPSPFCILLFFGAALLVVMPSIGYLF
jgi:hypothetical protein